MVVSALNLLLTYQTPCISTSSKITIGAMYVPPTQHMSVQLLSVRATWLRFSVFLLVTDYTLIYCDCAPLSIYQSHLYTDVMA